MRIDAPAVIIIILKKNDKYRGSAAMRQPRISFKFKTASVTMKEFSKRLIVCSGTGLDPEEILSYNRKISLGLTLSCRALINTLGRKIIYLDKRIDNKFMYNLIYYKQNNRFCRL